MFLDEPLCHTKLLPCDIVGDEFPVEMIDLVLHTSSLESLEGHFLLEEVHIPESNRDSNVAWDRRVELGNGEATLLISLIPVRFEGEPRIDHDVELSPESDNHDPLVNSNLRSRESCAVLFLHEILHRLDQPIGNLQRSGDDGRDSGETRVSQVSKGVLLGFLGEYQGSHWEARREDVG